MNDWTEKYRPKLLNQFIGNTKNISLLHKWADSWKKNKPHKRAIILSGKPGIGKTSCAYALANEFNWIPIELNTSDARNKDRIKAVATAGSNHQSFTNDGLYLSTDAGGRKLIILDEADNLYERISSYSNDGKNLSDKGGKKAIIQTIEQTNQPIILIVNDYYKLVKGSGKILDKLCLHLQFKPARPYQISDLLHRICVKEHIKIDDSLIDQLSTHCNGDIRSAIRDLQSLSIGRTEVNRSQDESIGNRDQQQQIFSILLNIFQTTDIATIRNSLTHLDLDPQMLLLWISENTPKQYSTISDIISAFHHISKADIYLSRTIKRNNYRMWAYASNHMSYGVSLSKTNPPLNARFQYSSWLRHRKKMDNIKDNQLIYQLASIHHCSIKKAKQDLYPFIKKLSEIKGIDVEELLHDSIQTNDMTKSFKKNGELPLDKSNDIKGNNQSVDKNKQQQKLIM